MQGIVLPAYVIGTLAAAAFGAILYPFVTGDSIVSALTNILTSSPTAEAGGFQPFMPR
jgi:hypothetical protein